MDVRGQSPNRLRMDLYDNDVEVLGSCPTDIDSPEVRSKFSALCNANVIMQSKGRQLSTLGEV